MSATTEHRGGRRAADLRPIELDFTTPEPMLVSEAMAGWAEDDGGEWSQFWRRSVRRYCRKSEQMLPGVQIQELRPRDVAAIKKAMAGCHSEANRYMSALSSTWRWAARNGIAEGANPVAAVNKERAPDFVVGDETPAVLLLGIDACEREGLLRPVFADWIDLRSRTLRLPMTKIERLLAQRHRLRAAEIVRRRIAVARTEGTRWLFSSGRTRQMDRPLQKTQAQWRRVLQWLDEHGHTSKRSDGKAWKLADLRAIAATLMSRNAEPFAVAEALGHLSIVTTYRYVRRDLKAAREAVVSYEEEFLSKGKDARQAAEVLAERLKARRIELGMTLVEVAEAAQMSKASLINYEHGRVDPQLRSLVALARALKTDLPSLTRGMPG